MVNIIMNEMYAVMKQRLYIEYGDYLAVSPAELKMHQFDEKTRRKLYWRDRGDWCEIGRVLRRQVDELECVRRTPIIFREPAKTIQAPVLDNINHVANKLLKPVHPRHIIYEIETCAARNELCYIGIAKMVDECHWAILQFAFAMTKHTRAYLT